MAAARQIKLAASWRQRHRTYHARGTARMYLGCVRRISPVIWFSRQQRRANIGMRTRHTCNTSANAARRWRLHIKTPLICARMRERARRACLNRIMAAPRVARTSMASKAAAQAYGTKNAPARRRHHGATRRQQAAYRGNARQRNDAVASHGGCTLHLSRTLSYRYRDIEQRGRHLGIDACYRAPR